MGGAGWGAGCVLLALCFLEWKLRCLNQKFETNGGGAGGEGCGWFRFVDFSGRAAWIVDLRLGGFTVSGNSEILHTRIKASIPKLKSTETSLGHPQSQSRKPSK